MTIYNDYPLQGQCERFRFLFFLFFSFLCLCIYVLLKKKKKSGHVAAARKKSRHLMVPNNPDPKQY